MFDEPPVRRRAVARRAGRLLRDDARRMAGLERPGRRAARPARCCAPGTCTTTSTRTARSCSGASRAARSARCRSRGTPGLFTTQFDANDAVHTPCGLNIANPVVEQSFADAVTDLRNAGIPLDAPLRDWQYERRGSRADPDPRRARHASASSTRSTSAGSGSGANAGYPNVPHGSSFVMAAQFTGDAAARSTRARSSPTRSRRTRTRRTSPTRRACSPTSSGSTRPTARTRSRPTRTSR